MIDLENHMVDHIYGNNLGNHMVDVDEAIVKNVWKLRQGPREVALGSTHRFTVASSTSATWFPRSLPYMWSTILFSRPIIWFKVNHLLKVNHGLRSTHSTHTSQQTLCSMHVEVLPVTMKTLHHESFFLPLFSDCLECEAYFYALCSLNLSH